MSSYAIFVLCIGTLTQDHFHTYFEQSVMRYCNKYHYDLHIIKDYIYKNEDYHRYNFISFIKHIIPSMDIAQKYKKICVLDADIIINENSPPFHTIELNGKIGIVDEYSEPSYEQRLQIQRDNNWVVTATEYYGLCDLEISTEKVLNTGVMFVEPELHAEFLKNVVNKYIDIYQSRGFNRGFHYEQSVIGYELQKNNMFYLLDNRWNRIWSMYKKTYTYNELFKDSYFIHHAGSVEYDLTKTI
jgi:hypothetical protein